MHSSHAGVDERGTVSGDIDYKIFVCVLICICGFLKQDHLVNTDCYSTTKKSANTLGPRPLALAHKSETSVRKHADL